jgi:hypothetical protein
VNVNLGSAHLNDRTLVPLSALILRVQANSLAHVAQRHRLCRWTCPPTNKLTPT